MKRPQLLKRRLVLLPTWPCAAALVAASAGLALWVVTAIHPFLAVTRKATNPDLLVIEGWMPDYNLPRVIDAFREGPYQQVGTTGIALDKGHYLQEFKSYGAVTAATLKVMGMKDEEILVGATTDTFRHRTYTAAVAMKQAVDDAGLEVDSLDVYSQGAHARRTWIIFRKVFGDAVDVGVVALPAEDYDNDRWWGSSAGIKTVGMELLALGHEWLLDSGRGPGD